MYSNNILNFQESTTILNACTKKVWKLIECTVYMDDIKIFAKNEKEQEILIRTVRIYDQDIEIELGKEKYVMLIIKKRQKERTEVIELPN